MHPSPATALPMNPFIALSLLDCPLSAFSRKSRLKPANNRQPTRLILHHGFHDANRRRTDKNYKDSREDEQNEREDKLDRCLGRFLFSKLLPPRSHRIGLHAQGLGD